VFHTWFFILLLAENGDHIQSQETSTGNRREKCHSNGNCKYTCNINITTCLGQSFNANSSFWLVSQDDLIDAQVSDDAGDSTDEESSEYSGLDDDEEDSSDGEYFEGSDSDGDEEGEEEEGSEGDDEDDGESDMSTSEDEEIGRAKIVEMEDGKPKSSIEQEPSTSAQPVEDEYAYDSSDEEVCCKN
jgi:hypothetical protein